MWLLAHCTHQSLRLCACAFYAGMRHAELGEDEDEDDEDFVGGDAASSSGGSDNESGDDSGDAEMIEEEGGLVCVYVCPCVVAVG